MKILLAIPYTKYVETDCWTALLSLQRNNGDQLRVRTYAKYSCAMARNIAAKDAVDGGFDYLFFVDSDQVIPPETLIKLMELNADMAVAWTMMAVGSDETNIALLPPGRTCFKFHSQSDMLQDMRPFPIDAAGLAISLIKVDVFKEMEYPYFRYVEYGNGETLSEDLNFCISLKAMGKEIMVDPALRAGHIKITIL